MDTSVAKFLGTRSKAKQTAAELQRAFGIETVGDLLRHYPRRYVERNTLTEIASLEVGDEVTIVAEVEKVDTRPMRGRPGFITEVVVRDSSLGRLTLTYFANAYQSVHKQTGHLRPGRRALFAGTVTRFRGMLQLTHPKCELTADEEEAEGLLNTLISIYPATSVLASWDIAKPIRSLVETLPITDPLPEALRGQRGLVDLGTALRWIHRPESYEQVGAAKKRLKWDEALAVQLSLVQRKRRSDAVPATPRHRRPDGLLSTFDSSLPFELTAGQRAIGADVAADLERPHPMHRLLQGEVGSGKTIVALRAMLQVVDAGAQAALLAPTEVLAAQHYRSVRALLGPLGRAGELDSHPDATSVVLLTGSQPAAARRRAVDEAASGRAGIVIGTHALLYQGVSFHDLGLVVIDEQHRFGVEQRDALRAKAGQIPPHVLVMTATPIPRTVAMTVFGDLETSELTELPGGRSTISTHIVPTAEKPQFLDRAWQRLREEVGKGHQAYVVCPRIGGDKADDDAPADEQGPDRDADDGAPARRQQSIALLEVAPLLQAEALAGMRVGILHGRLPGEEKDRVMREFAAGRLDVLISTTVIEVGVDVPNATMMVVLDADRFGLSQLHQLRGRVGRGSAPGLCLLVTDAPAGTTSRERLDAVASTLDGFELARQDLALRREGDVLGEAQSGRTRHLRMLSLVEDEPVIVAAREQAGALLDQDPDLHAHAGLAALVAATVDEERAEFLEKG
ncbi:MAG TPA: ATP-dependent DNA helicase RecG [Micromonosporaceae bacterium]|jgi:ATP-dependent DNA helicase RecG